MSPHVICLSPHLDDAALSSGGFIAQLTRAGTSVLVVTIFAGFPQCGRLSALAARLHTRWGAPNDPVAVRRKEDETALALLGAHPLHLQYPDAIYRAEKGSFLYLCEDDLFDSPHPSDVRLVPRIARSVDAICRGHTATIYAPLAVGNHVDHQLVREAALILLCKSFRVLFYEDYPYVETPHALTTALKSMRVPRLNKRVNRIEEDCLKAKIHAIALYASQMDELFGGTEAMGQRVRDYALTVSASGGYAERYWVPCSGTHPKAQK